MKSLRCFFLAVAALAYSRLPAQYTTGTLINTSALVTLPPGGMATVGFFAATQNSPQPGNTLLIRAVGPTLTTFGIKNPAPLPHLRLFNAKGQDITTTVVIGSIDWNATFALAGAFPLTGGERPMYAYNIGPVGGLQSAGYTVQVTDDSGNGGAVLIEVYVIPSVAFVLGAPT
jgi:hypothetical protein